MNVLRNLPNLIKLLRSVRIFNFYAKDITAAKNEGDVAKEREAIAYSTHIWASKVEELFHLSFDIRGRENIPSEDGCVFISNHQGYADIIAMFLALEGKQIGFIAKDSLEKAPYFGTWIKNIRGIYIHRGNAREAMKPIQEGAETLQKGFNLVIFPEGTRSQGPVMGQFKAGSFKLATKAKAPIVPVTINGSYKAFEEKGVMRPAKITVVIHPAIQTKDLDRKGLHDMETNVEETIRTTLSQLVAEEKQSN